MKLVVIAGPTGTGKSDFAVRLALATGGEIVNYDSIQIYRGFDIGSAKPSAEQRRAVPHHLFDIAGAAGGIVRTLASTASRTRCSSGVYTATFASSVLLRNANMR